MIKKNPTQVNSPQKFVQMERGVMEEVSHFLFALGNQFISVKNSNGAFDCFKYAVDLDPKNHAAVYNLAVLYNLSGNHEGAYRMFKEASRMAPNDIVTKTAFGELARKRGYHDEAAKIFSELLSVDPTNELILRGLAILHYDLGELEKALELNNSVLALRPEGDIYMELNRALINMAYGKWPEWWIEYERCLSYNKNERMRSLSMDDAWSGQEMEGKHLVVVSDQGVGDAIQFSRYLLEAKKLGKFGRLTFLVQPELNRLLSRLEGIECVSFGDKMSLDYDAYASLLGIMRVLAISPENCRREPHIVTDPSLDDEWRVKVEQECPDTAHWKVGIVWAGDPKHGNDHARSLTLKKFLRFDYGSLKFFSLQVGKPAEQLDDVKGVVDLGSTFRDFDDTASAMRQMDLIITCDTSVAHLAGSLGTKCWVLISNPPEWRWLLEGDKSAWYDSVTLFRQKFPRQWDGVLDNVLHALLKLTRN